MVRRMLQADLPAAVRSDEDVEAEVWRNYNWNFSVNVIDGALFLLAQSLMSATTILPFFVTRLTDNPFYIGLLAVIANGGWFFPQLFSAGAIERTDRKKPWLINLGFFLERMPLVLLTAATLFAVQLALLGPSPSSSWHSPSTTSAPASSPPPGRTFSRSAFRPPVAAALWG